MTRIFASLLCVLLATPAHAMTASDAAPKCATAIDARLRDPSGVRYLFDQRIVTQHGDTWIVLLPVRGTNAFGGTVTQTFVCKIVGGEVVQVAQ